MPIILVAIGTVWVGQGSGLLKGTSFMVGDPRWSVAGGAAIAVAIALMAAARRGASS